MWRRWADYDTERPLRPWLAGIAFKVAHDYRRRSGREVPGGLVDAEDQAPGAEEHLASSRARTLVLRALASLPEKQRTIIVMHDLDGASMREIADLLSVPLFTAYSRLRSARQAFAKAVRRLHTLALATAGLDRLPPPVLLQAERVPPPAPPGTRRRAVSRARALALAPLPPTDAGSGPPPPRATSRALPFMVGASVIAAVGVFSLVTSAPPGHSISGASAGAHDRDGSKLRRKGMPGPRSARSPRSTEIPGSSGTAEPAVRAGEHPVFVASASPSRRRLRPGLAQDLARGLVGYWRFDDGGDTTTAHDLSGNGNDCLVHNLDPASRWSDGVSGGAVSLDGHGFISCARPDTWAALSTELTIATWVKKTAEQMGIRSIVSRQLGTDSKDYFLLGLTSERVVFSSSVWNVRLTPIVPQDVGRWMHLAATRAADGNTALYVDGAEVARVTASDAAAAQATIAGGTNAMIIGGGVNVPNPDRPTELFQGDIDDLVIYRRALSVEEIGALAAGARPQLTN
jgi:RNA polymerase sigma factor (sigma-70 family)